MRESIKNNIKITYVKTNLRTDSSTSTTTIAITTAAVANLTMIKSHQVLVNLHYSFIKDNFSRQRIGYSSMKIACFTKARVARWMFGKVIDWSMIESGWNLVLQMNRK
jgi:hypothetical protein